MILHDTLLEFYYACAIIHKHTCTPQYFNSCMYVTRRNISILAKTKIYFTPSVWFCIVCLLILELTEKVLFTYFEVKKLSPINQSHLNSSTFVCRHKFEFCLIDIFERRIEYANSVFEVTLNLRNNKHSLVSRTLIFDVHCCECVISFLGIGLFYELRKVRVWINYSCPQWNNICSIFCDFFLWTCQLMNVHTALEY